MGSPGLLEDWSTWREETLRGLGLFSLKNRGLQPGDEMLPLPTSIWWEWVDPYLSKVHHIKMTADRQKLQMEVLLYMLANNLIQNLF